MGTFALNFCNSTTLAIYPTTTINLLIFSKFVTRKRFMCIPYFASVCAT